MQLIKAEKGKCEMGACKKRAAYSIRMDRIGIKSRIDICAECLKKLYGVLGEAVVPKSIETIRKPV